MLRWIGIRVVHCPVGIPVDTPHVINTLRVPLKSDSCCSWMSIISFIISFNHRSTQVKGKVNVFYTKWLIVTLCNWLAFSSGTRSSSLQWRIWNSDSLELSGILWGCVSLHGILLSVYGILYIILEFIVNFFDNSLGILGT